MENTKRINSLAEFTPKMNELVDRLGSKVFDDLWRKISNGEEAVTEDEKDVETLITMWNKHRKEISMLITSSYKSSK